MELSLIIYRFFFRGTLIGISFSFFIYFAIHKAKFILWDFIIIDRDFGWVVKVPYFCEYSYLWPFGCMKLYDEVCYWTGWYGMLSRLVLSYYLPAFCYIYLLVHVVLCWCIKCKGRRVREKMGGVGGHEHQQAFLRLVQASGVDAWLVLTIKKRKREWKK